MFFFGFGYVASAVAPLLREQGWDMAGTTRTNDKVNAMWEQGVEPHIWPGEAPLEAPLKVLKGVTHILISIPPGPQGDVVIKHHQRLLVKLAPDLEWIGYLSACTVYGDTKGEWCSEDYQPNPATPRGKLRLRVETNFRKIGKKASLPMHVFRAGAIYGPGRNAIGRVAKGRARIFKKADHYISRVHVEDLAATILASIQKPNPNSIYNVVDDYPSGLDEPVEFAAKALGMPQPPISDADENPDEVPPAFQNSLSENRRVRNDLIKSELGVQLQYPTFREGYQSLIDRAFQRRQDRLAEESKQFKDSDKPDQF